MQQRQHRLLPLLFRQTGQCGLEPRQPIVVVVDPLDLVAGQIPMATINVTGQLLELHRTGKIRILAVTSPERLKGVPDIPTAVEEGMPGMVAQLFTGLFLPARTPRAIVEQVYQASQKAMNDPAMQTALIEQGLEPITNSSPEKVTAFMQEEVARWAPVVKAAGLKTG